MAFDPFSPSFAPTGPSGDPSFRLQPLPQLENIGSPRQQPFEAIRPVDYQPNPVPATVVKGLGQVVENAATGLDAALKIGIDQETRKGVDDILNKQIQAGVDTKQKLLEETTNKASDAPLALGQGLDRLSTLDKAKRSGALSDDTFYNRISELVSGLKAKYPGYTSVIDEKIKQVTGTDPAEGRRKALQADITQLHQDQILRQTKLETFVMQNAGLLEARDPDWRTKPVSQNVSTITQGLADQEVNKQQLAALQLKKEQGTSMGSDAQKYAAGALNNRAGIAFASFDDKILSQSGKSFAELMSGGPMKPDELKVVDSYLKQAELMWENDGRNVFMQTTLPGGGTTVYSLLAGDGGGTDKMNKMIADANPFTKMREMISGTDSMSMINVQSALLKLQKDRNQSGVIANSPAIANVASIGQLLGPELSKIVFDNPKVAVLFSDAVNSANALINAQGGTSVSDLSKKMQNENPNGVDPKVWSAQIDNKLKIMTATGIDKTFQEQHFRDVFLDHDPGYILRQSKGEAMDLFLTLTNKDIQHKVSKMPDDIQAGYANWVRSNFGALFSRTADTVRGEAQSSPFYKIVLTPDGHFDTQPTKAGELNPQAYSNATNSIKTSLWGQPSLTKLNAGIDVIKPVLEKQGINVHDYIAQRSGLGLNPDEQPKGGILYGVRKTLHNAPDETSPTDNLKNLIRKGESSNNYDSMFGVSGAKVSSMTVDEVLAKQQERAKAGTESTAAGGYQFINSTLKGLKKEMGLSGNEKMTSELQEKLADTLLEKRGLSDYKAGKISKYQLANNLAQEWASLPNMTGKSHYDGVGSNKATIGLEDLLSSIDKL